MTPQSSHITGGWIRLHRCLKDNPLWLERPFDRARAWVDLLLLANHAEGYIRRRGIRITVKRGQVGWSQENLAERWGWSKGKVRRFLEELKNDDNISLKTELKNVAVTSLISITNYEKYQKNDTEDDTENGPKVELKTVLEQKEVKRIKNKPVSTFSEFWIAFPRKVGKASAEKAWLRISPDESLLKQIIYALEWQSQQPDWLKDDGKFIPHPATWLNGRRWEDERPVSFQQPSQPEIPSYMTDPAFDDQGATDAA